MAPRLEGGIVGQQQHFTVDTLLSCANTHFFKWSRPLTRNGSWWLLRRLILRLYDAGRGQLVNVQTTIAQTTLSQQLGLTPQWTCRLVRELEAAGWIEHYAPRRADGMNGATIWRAGRQLKRLVIMLTKSAMQRAQKRARPQSTVCNSPFIFSPRREEKTMLSILAKEQEPPSPGTVQKIPLLKRWLERGQGN
jgi:hypothetical protein